jgi:hypothetical protein
MQSVQTLAVQAVHFGGQAYASVAKTSSNVANPSLKAIYKRFQVWN